MNIKKKTIGIFCLAVVLFAIPITVSAYSFSLNLPDHFVGSMRSTTLEQKKTNSTPYVDPKYNILPTDYFLSPERLSSTLATDVTTISNGANHSFIWKSGYGGVKTSYCLSAYPHMSGSWQAYTVQGTWGN